MVDLNVKQLDDREERQKEMNSPQMFTILHDRRLALRMPAVVDTAPNFSSQRLARVTEQGDARRTKIRGTPTKVTDFSHSTSSSLCLPAHPPSCRSFRLQQISFGHIHSVFESRQDYFWPPINRHLRANNEQHLNSSSLTFLLFRVPSEEEEEEKEETPPPRC